MFSPLGFPFSLTTPMFPSELVHRIRRTLPNTFQGFSFFRYFFGVSLPCFPSLPRARSDTGLFEICVFLITLFFESKIFLPPPQKPFHFLIEVPLNILAAVVLSFDRPVALSHGRPSPHFPGIFFCTSTVSPFLFFFSLFEPLASGTGPTFLDQDSLHAFFFADLCWASRRFPACRDRPAEFEVFFLFGSYKRHPRPPLVRGRLNRFFNECLFGRPFSEFIVFQCGFYSG